MNKIISTVFEIIALLFIVALFVMLIAWAFQQFPPLTRIIIINSFTKEEVETQTLKIVEASWYNEKHCLGCRKDLLMANGKKLNSSKNTCAYNDLPLGSIVILRYRDKATWCEITDRVGLNRIDLTSKTFSELALLSLGIIDIEIEKLDN